MLSILFFRNNSKICQKDYGFSFLFFPPHQRAGGINSAYEFSNVRGAASGAPLFQIEWAYCSVVIYYLSIIITMYISIYIFICVSVISTCIYPRINTGFLPKTNIYNLSVLKLSDN